MRENLLFVGILLCVLPQVFGSRDWSSDDSDLYRKYFNSERAHDECQAESCDKCIQVSNCRWCTGRRGQIPKCKPNSECPLERHAKCKTAAEQDYRENYLARSLLKDVPVPSQVTSNASSLCAQNTNCSQCVASKFCIWCQKKKQCIVYYNSSTATSNCQSNLWYKNQCIYPATTKPCPLRRSSCKECIQGNICYWCDSTKKCAYYPHKNYIPKDCALHEMFYEKCTHMQLIIVLIPVLCIVLIPVLTYIILWVVMCCLKATGNTDQTDKPEPKGKAGGNKSKEKPRPIRLHHEPPRSKTEELKKKYGLGNRP